MKIVFTLLIILMSGYGAYTQDYSQKYLAALEDEQLLSLFNELSGDSIIAEKIARVYLQRGRDQNDTIKIARGYDRLARIFNPKKNISFADSIIEITNSLDNITYPGLGYMLRGYGYYSQNDIKKSMEDFSIAYELSKNNGNISQQMVVSDILIYYKAIWGNKEEALQLQKERHTKLLSDHYQKEVKKSTRKTLNHNYDQLYLEDKILSIQNYIFCYLSLKKLDSAKSFLIKGRQALHDYYGSSKSKFDFWFNEASLEIEYYSKNYYQAIHISNQLLTYEHINHSSLMNIYFFKGLSHIESKNYLEGIKFLKISDSIYDNSQSEIPIKPYKRELFERLLNYYQKNRDSSKSIMYMKKLMYLDSILKVNYQYFEPTHIKKFETPKLLEEKDTLISELKISNRDIQKTSWWIAFILILSLIFLAIYIYRYVLFERRFKELEIKNSKANEDNPRVKKNTLSHEVVEEILQKLTTFEEQHAFLKKDLYLQDLAKNFGTNSNYLSRVINLKMEKNYSQYIHHLRVGYSMEQLLTNRKIRNYTIKAIAEECGYSNAESYSRAFYKINGIYPSYFIKKINQKKV